jgi:hypothetical protein
MFYRVDYIVALLLAGALLTVIADRRRVDTLTCRRGEPG